MTQDKMTKDTPAPNEMPDYDEGLHKIVMNFCAATMSMEECRNMEIQILTYFKICREFDDITQANLRAPVAAGGENKPAVYYCENGKTLEGLEQGALAVLSNLMIKTNAQTAEFMIGNEKDGEFYFTCSRGKQPAAPAVDLEKLKRHYVDAYEFWDRASVDFIEHMIDDLAAQGMIKGRG